MVALLDASDFSVGGSMTFRLSSEREDAFERGLGVGYIPYMECVWDTGGAHTGSYQLTGHCAWR